MKIKIQTFVQIVNNFNSESKQSPGKTNSSEKNAKSKLAQEETYNLSTIGDSSATLVSNGVCTLV